jgi:hypothetical protein
MPRERIASPAFATFSISANTGALSASRPFE